MRGIRRDQEIPITAGAPGSEAESSGTEDGGGDPSADPVLIPPAVDSGAGRTLQRNIAGHRLWRFAPFNFEKYPGMRMNVPPDKTAWTVSFLRLNRIMKPLIVFGVSPTVIEGK